MIDFISLMDLMPLSIISAYSWYNSVLDNLVKGKKVDSPSASPCASEERYRLVSPDVIDKGVYEKLFTLSP